jgi:hypothetical protein
MPYLGQVNRSSTYTERPDIDEAIDEYLERMEFENEEEGLCHQN